MDTRKFVSLSSIPSEGLLDQTLDVLGQQLSLRFPSVVLICPRGVFSSSSVVSRWQILTLIMIANVTSVLQH